MDRCEVVSGGEVASRCYGLRAAEYGRFYRNIPAGRFTDEFDTAATAAGDPVSRLIAATAGGAVVGTCRLTLGRHPAHPGLRSEVGELADLPWAELAAAAGADPAALVVAELGKFAVERTADVRRVKWGLLTAAGRAAGGLGVHAVVALMPPLVERAARHAGVRFHRLSAAGLRRGCPRARRVLLRYADYFLPGLRRGNPGVDLGRVDDLDPAALDALLAAVPDGPKVWWITPAELAAAAYPGDRA